MSANWTFTMSIIHVSLITILWNGGEVVVGAGQVGSRS